MLRRARVPTRAPRQPDRKTEKPTCCNRRLPKQGSVLPRRAPKAAPPIISTAGNAAAAAAAALVTALRISGVALSVRLLPGLACRRTGLAAAQQLPDNSEIQDHLGDVHLRRGSFQDAIAAWTRALAGSGQGIEKVVVEKKINDAKVKLQNAK